MCVASQLVSLLTTHKAAPRTAHPRTTTCQKWSLSGAAPGSCFCAARQRVRPDTQAHDIEAAPRIARPRRTTRYVPDTELALARSSPAAASRSFTAPVACSCVWRSKLPSAPRPGVSWCAAPGAPGRTLPLLRKSAIVSAAEGRAGAHKVPMPAQHAQKQQPPSESPCDGVRRAVGADSAAPRRGAGARRQAARRVADRATRPRAARAQPALRRRRRARRRRMVRRRRVHAALPSAGAAQLRRPRRRVSTDARIATRHGPSAQPWEWMGRKRRGEEEER